MTHYYIKSCYIKNKSAFVMSVLGCINREVIKIDRDDFEKRKRFGEALSALSHALMVALRVEKDPDVVLGMYDSLEATLTGTFYSKIQESADDMVELLDDCITIHFTGPFGEISTEFIEWLPYFGDKVKISFEE